MLNRFQKRKRLNKVGLYDRVINKAIQQPPESFRDITEHQRNRDTKLMPVDMAILNTLDEILYVNKKILEALKK